LATLDVGIYNSAGTRLVSKGATAVSNTGNWQSFDITDTTLVPGLYYVGVLGDWATTACNVYRHSMAAAELAKPYYSQAVAAAALPATATFANSGYDYLPLVGIVTGTVTL
jgi:hypothetical protein